MAEKQKVVFRRVRGRIVPIKVKDDSERIKKAATLGAAAAVTGVAGGLGAAAIVKGSAALRTKAKKDFRLVRALERSLKRNVGLGGQLSLGLEEPLAKGFKQNALKNRLFSRTMFKMRNPLLNIASLVAGNLAASAIIEGTKKRESVGQEVAIQTGAGIAALGVSAIYYKGLGLSGLKNLRYAVRRSRGVTRPAFIPIKSSQGVLKL